MKKYRWILPLMVIIIFAGCSRTSEHSRLPYLGRKEVVPVNQGGTVTYDTLYHQIDEFRFINQDSVVVTEKTFEDKIYVADFFFTTCPTICPVMKAQMLRVYDQFEDNESVMFLSHTIDPEYDTVGVLKNFSERLGVSSKKWHFVTGPMEDIYEIGQTSYMVTAMEDRDAPGGFLHSGAFILVDKERHIRGMYDGTDEKEVNRLINDIPRLLNEYENR